MLDNEHKPGGFWLSDDAESGWGDFLRRLIAGGDPNWADAKSTWKYVTEFKVAIEQILWLKYDSELRQFAALYGEADERDCSDGSGLHIERGRVKADYKGILISPYQECLSHRRGDPMFHWYRFDCASACIWDSSCLVSCGDSVESGL